MSGVPQRRRVAVAIGDPAGIGCEVALKAVAHSSVSSLVAPVLVGDAGLIERCNETFGTGCKLNVATSADALGFAAGTVDVLHVPGLDLDAFAFGKVSAANGRALLAYADAAIRLAECGTVDAVVAAPQNQTSVKLAGIPFDGYSSYVARVTGTPEDEMYLMVTSERFRITHVTLHVSMREAIDLVKRPRVLSAIRATQHALHKMGVVRPRLAVSGLNPHAGEHGMWGREEIVEIAPAVAEARAEGIDVSGPLGADVMLARGDADAYVVMIHDQGHIPVKLETGSGGFAIGGPVLFASVAHGSAHDIAGKGVADASNMIKALRWSAGAAQKA